MVDHKPRALREQFAARVRLLVQGERDIAERYAENLSEGGLFIKGDKPAVRGATVLLEFTLADGTPLSRCAARVVHSRPGVGMGLEFIQLDEVAKKWLARFGQGGAEPAAESPDPRDLPPAQRLTDIGRSGAPTRLLSLSGPVVGIDLGTSNSCVALVTDGTAKVIIGPGGYETIPSIVHFGDDDDVAVGSLARERMILDPTRAVYASKRFLGRPYASREVKTLAHFYRYELTAGPQGRVAARIDGNVIPLEEVAGHILAQLKQIASVHCGQAVQRAVVTVPAYFGETQRQAVRDAGRHAGVYVERILNEPTAAAVAYGFGRGLNETVLVYDFGGGTFDASILRIAGDRMEVLATDGDPFLGGTDLDDRLTEYLLSTFKRQTGVDLREETVAVQRVRFGAEMAKRQLSSATEASVNLPFIHATDKGPMDLDITLTRTVLEELTNDLVDRTLVIVQNTLDAAALKSEQLDDIILVGGQSRSPAVRRLLFERFGKKPRTQVHPDEAIALGAARVAQGFTEAQAQVDLTDVLAASIRTAAPGGGTVVQLRRGARLPTEKTFDVVIPDADDTRLSLLRGEGEGAADNTLLGDITLPGIPAAASCPRHATVTLSVSADGLLSARADHPVAGHIGELEVLLL